MFFFKIKLLWALWHRFSQLNLAHFCLGFLVRRQDKSKFNFTVKFLQDQATSKWLPPGAGISTLEIAR